MEFNVTKELVKLLKAEYPTMKSFTIDFVETESVSCYLAIVKDKDGNEIGEWMGDKED